MAEMDMGLSPQNKKNNNGKKKKKKKKQNLFMSIVTGLIPWKGDSTTEIFRKLIFLLSLGVLIFAVVLIFNHVILITGDRDVVVSNPGNTSGDEADAPTYIVDLKNQAPTQEQIDKLPEGTINEEYAALYEANNDFVGWININGTNIDYPVLQSGEYPTFEHCETYKLYGVCSFCDEIEADHRLATQFYLHHDFNRNYLFDGNIFADYEGIIGPDTMPDNTILYGHNMLYKHQFSALTNYYNNIEFLKKSPVIDFNTMYQNNKYKIFAVFITNTTKDVGEVFDYYNHVYYNNSSEFYDYILECMDRSIYETGVDVQYGDQILTLSTCDASTALEDMRLLVVARKVRDNESPEVDTSKIARKSSVKFCEGYTNIYGNRWKGRTWDISLVKGMAEYLKENGLEDPAE